MSNDKRTRCSGLLRRLCVAFAALVLVAGAAPQDASASVVMAAGLTDLVTQADDVAVVDVISVQSRWDAHHERIYSAIELRVVESWKGGHNTGEQVTLYQPGGTVGEITQIVSGLAAFQPGERSLVFLRGRTQRRTVVGLAQGKRQVRQDAAGNWMVAGPDMTGLKLVPRSGQPLPQPTGPMKLDDMRARVRELTGAAR